MEEKGGTWDAPLNGTYADMSSWLNTMNYNTMYDHEKNAAVWRTFNRWNILQKPRDTWSQDDYKNYNSIQKADSEYRIKTEYGGKPPEAPINGTYREMNDWRDLMNYYTMDDHEKNAEVWRTFNDWAAKQGQM